MAPSRAFFLLKASTIDFTKMDTMKLREGLLPALFSLMLDGVSHDSHYFLVHVNKGHIPQQKNWENS